jgi:hypothetical protein
VQLLDSRLHITHHTIVTHSAMPGGMHAMDHACGCVKGGGGVGSTQLCAVIVACCRSTDQPPDQ